MARRRRKFVRLSSYWPENVRGTSFLGKKGSNGPPQAKIWWVKYVAAGGKVRGTSFLNKKGEGKK